MPPALANWETKFMAQVDSGTACEKAGAWLPMVPSHEEWEEFLVSVRQEWAGWLWDLGQYEDCLLMLYEGVAFFFYEGGAFWEAFGMATTGSREAPAPQRQSAINRQFERLCSKYNLPIHRHPGHTSFVGSAVYHVGIPIKVWSGFVAVCEWAWYCAEWKSMPAESWEQRVGMLVPPRLRRFLCDNRDTAAKWIEEVHDVRRILDENPTWGLSDIKEASFLRPEYFDEVPETADFLRERDPDSLFRDRPRLSWSDRSGEISVQLPAVDREKLPASWKLGGLSWTADTNPRPGRLNSEAFVPSLLFVLETGRTHETESRRISGLGEWALYDICRQRFTNATREELPLSRYAILSLQPLNLAGEGWIEDEEEPQRNVEYRFPGPNGSPYFVTELTSEKNKATLDVNGKRFVFRQRQKVNLRIFSATGSHRFRFGFDGASVLICEEWPRLVLEDLGGYLDEDDLGKEFHVFVDGHRVHGRWLVEREKDEDPPVFYFWKWHEQPMKTDRPPRTVLHDLDALTTRALAAPPLTTTKEHEMWVQSPRMGRIPLGPRTSQKIMMTIRPAEDWWPTQPGAFLIWVLLSEVQDEATWEEISIAQNELCWFQNTPSHQVYYQLRKIEQAGMATRKGRLWADFENRIWFDRPHGKHVLAKYAGLTTHLYTILRAISPVRRIEIPKPERGRPPHLEVVWESRYKDRLRQKCREVGMKIMEENLWTP